MGNPKPRMPLGQPPLSEHEINILRSWIDSGAQWNPNGLPLRDQVSVAPRKPPVPQNGESHPVDAFVARYAKAKGVSLSPQVADSVFVRRAYLDIIGLPPSPEEQDAFLSQQDTDKRARLIDRLLSDRQRYAEHWITLWNDLLRNEDGVAYPGETREWITGWLLRALETNLPYHRMVRELLNPEGKDAPRGFLAGINWGGDVSASQSVPMQAAQNSAQVFLGASLKCASCHDSFVSRWKVAETFALAAYFSDKPLEISRCEVKTGATATAKFVFPEVESSEPLAEGSTGRARAAALFTSPGNGRFARTIVNRYWRVLFGRGLVEPVDDMESPAWDQDLIDWLASDFTEHNYDLQFLLRRIMTSHAYASAAVKSSQQEFVFRGPQVRRLTAEQFTDAIGAVTGEWNVYDRQNGTPASYERQWRFRSDRLTRALGRPDRSQVITQRENEATTLQALELVNGEKFADRLRRGARRLLTGIPEPPSAIFDSGMVRATPASVDVDITGISKLWLVMQDSGSYDAASVVAGWTKAQFIGPGGPVRLADLATANVRDINIKKEAQRAIAGTPPWRMSFDIAGKGYTRFTAMAGLDDASLRPETTGRARFFVFTQEPDRERLVRASGPAPVPEPPRLTGDALVSRLFRHTLARDPLPAERKQARRLLSQGSAGLEDLLWILFLSPEFQYIR
jgi:hypothetical protein